MWHNGIVPFKIQLFGGCETAWEVKVMFGPVWDPANKKNMEPNVFKQRGDPNTSKLEIKSSANHAAY